MEFEFQWNLVNKLVVYGDGYSWFMTQILQPLIEPYTTGSLDVVFTQ